MNNMFKGGFNAVHRQSLVISLTAFFTSLLLIALVSVLFLITFRGGAYFWPEPIYDVTYKVTGANESAKSEHKMFAQLYMADEVEQIYQVHFADEQSPYGSQMQLASADIINKELAYGSAEIKTKDGRFVLGQPEFLSTPDSRREDLSLFSDIQNRVSALSAQIEKIRRERLSPIHESLASLDSKGVDQNAPARERLETQFERWQHEVIHLEEERDEYEISVTFANAQAYAIRVSEIKSVDYVSQLSYFEKWQVVFSRIATFLTDSPKQANTSGGVYPALLGTVLMVFLMTIIVTPFGVLAAIYLSEYAPDTPFTTAIRISVSNMAGVPSIVYGVFGLGFFVYTLGGNIDALFFADRLPAPTMGTPGVFWASLTMAILTLPVVIVATEEGLRRVPEGLKRGSYALGATKVETIAKTILPIASPGIMTGVILAIARAAGEVAPLMLVGAVKFAPTLPIDGEFPYLHLERQFMHLGVLIYDGAFHSHTDAKNSSMMFAACLLLLIVVSVLNVLAVILRTRLRKRYLQG
jgi:phosphate transport system permease protein